jgi:hypothetical protein
MTGKHVDVALDALERVVEEVGAGPGCSEQAADDLP